MLFLAETSADPTSVTGFLGLPVFKEFIVLATLAGVVVAGVVFWKFVGSPLVEKAVTIITAFRDTSENLRQTQVISKEIQEKAHLQVALCEKQTAHFAEAAANLQALNQQILSHLKTK